MKKKIENKLEFYFRAYFKSAWFILFLPYLFQITCNVMIFEFFSVKSRVLLSLREEEDLTWYHPYGPLTPRSQPEFSDHEKESQETNQKDTNPTEPVVVGRLEVVTVDQRFHQANCTTRKHGENLHPEIISPMGLANPCIEKSVETETAWNYQGISLHLKHHGPFFIKCCYVHSRWLLLGIVYYPFRLFSTFHLNFF